MPAESHPPPAALGAIPPPAPRREFATTRWSVVLQAGRETTAASRDALARLCGSTWYPLYAHVRRRGVPRSDAEDLTQAFFAHLLRRHVIARADPARGRFRTFLLTTLDHFLADEGRRQHARKRGGGVPELSLDWAAAEQRLELEPADADAPDKAFDRRWALTLLERVVQQLEAEYRVAGKGALFAALRRTLIGAGETQPYAALAETLGLTEGAVKVAVHRLRHRYRTALRAEIADTVASAEDADAELRHLFQALARP